LNSSFSFLYLFFLSTSTHIMAQPQSQWAFEGSYSKNLPTEFNFNPQTGFAPLANWAAALTPAANSQIQLVTKIATYVSHKDKQTEIASSPTQTEEDAAKLGATLSTTRSLWLASRPVVGLVTSPMSSAVQHQAQQNDWHTVAMARDGDTVWVHDPQYAEADYSSHPRKRVASVPGNKLVKALIDQWPRVRGVWYQGPPSTFSSGQQQCMGRSAMWVDSTLDSTSPWPPNSPNGGTWIFHHKN
jgi:hypothetical protein